MLHPLLAVLLALPLLSRGADTPSGEAQTALQTLPERGSYSVGYQIGQDMRRQGIELNLDTFARGLRDALSQAEPALDEASRRTAWSDLRAQAAAVQREVAAREAEQKRAAGRDYMARNATQPGVMTTPSGMQYRIVTPGTGKTPSARDSVTVHYRGTLINGEEFDSSFKRNQPASFPLNGVIAGWTEGLQLVQEGGKLMLTIPPELAYGERGRLAHETLIFEVELLSVQVAQ